MTAPTRAEARRLADEAADRLTAAGLNVTATTNTTEAPAALAAGDLVVVVNPPTITFETWTQVVAEWAVWLIVGPPLDTDTAWDTLDRALGILARPLAVDTATPNVFTDAQGTPWPALVLATTSDHLTDQ